jgi:Na+/H+-dicarboxylate symporter
MRLERKILLGFAVGIVVGFVSRAPGAEAFRTVVIAIEPVGTAFIRLVTMVVVPLVIASVFVGVASLGDVRTLGRVGGKTLAYFLGTTLIAAVIGLAVATVAGVGQGLPELERAALTNRVADAAATTAATQAATAPTLVQTLLNMIPQNPFAAAAQGGGDLLPMIVAVCIFAAAATVTTSEGRGAVVRFFEGMNELSMIVIGWFMRLAPVAVFVLIAATVARSGLMLLSQLLAFSLVVIIALAAHVLIVFLPALRLGAHVGVRAFVQSVSDALLVAFSTASSNATLPVSMVAARERLGVRGDIVSFVLPAGASLDKNGSAVYKAVTAVFLARLYGLPITGSTMVTIVLIATVAAFAGAGVPGSSLVTTVIVLNAIGLGPRAAAGIALVAAVDRPLDMCRSTVNTIGNLVGAAWISRTEERVA